MTVLDYILDGLEAELALERELGVRVVEFDRALLAVETAVTVPAPAAASVVGAPERNATGGAEKPLGGREGALATDARGRATPPRPPRADPPRPERPSCDFVFLHHKALSAAGMEMMAKIVTAMGKTPESAPILVEPPVPKVKAVIVLGGLALKKFYPKLQGGPGEWRDAENGDRVLITYSPEYVLRYKHVTSGVMEIKRKMWSSLKVVLQKTKG